ncbi:MAG: histidine kinase [Chitinophagaceae bacterium]|nr:histidine kinase [Chitinophagaceae bacterium]
MNWHEFVFSEKKIYRLSRHIVFWLAWLFYLFSSKYLLPQPFSKTREARYVALNSVDLVQLLLILFIHILACYAVIYYLLPRFLLKARYFLFAAGILFLGFAMIEATRFIDSVVIPFIQPHILNAANAAIKKPTYWASISAGGISGIKIIAAAAAIKIGKHWWFKQKEKERLEKETIQAELQLLKAQIHPSFLFNTLNNIYSFALSASPKAPQMLLKFSDILSYMLYDCNESEVSLENEIKMLKDYMALEKMRYGDKLEMNIQVKGDPACHKIATLLLLHFVENSFKQCSSRMTEQPWINLEMQIENHVLDMKLMNGKPLNSEISNNEEDDLYQAKRLLQLLYPDSHKLKITDEPEIMMISLQIELHYIAEQDENLITENTTTELLPIARLAGI